MAKKKICVIGLGYIGLPTSALLANRGYDVHGVDVVQSVVDMIKKGQKIEGAKILIMGITFKENCPDIRNSRVIDVIRELQEYGCDISIEDYWADAEEVQKEYNLELKKDTNKDDYEAIVLAVAHDEYRNMKIGNDNQVIFDIKSILEKSDGRL